LGGVVPDNGCLINWFVNPDLGGSIGSGYLYHLGPWDEQGRSAEWLFACGFGPDDPERFDEEEMKRRIVRSLGVEGLDATVHSISHWYINAVVADRFRSGRCFLVGDAAHRVPPWGALGLNTGIQDAHNLAWKIAAALRSPELASLLETYETERRPIATTVAENSLHNFTNHGGLVDKAIGLDPAAPASTGWEMFADLWSESGSGLERRRALADAIEFMDHEFHAHGVECGFAYPRGAIAGDGPERALPVDPLVYRPTSAPGHHVPHVWLHGGAGRVSTLDLADGGRLALVVAPEGADGWREAVASAVASDVAPLAALVDVVVVGDDRLADPEGEWERLREVGPRGAVLVRPDTFVAWRSMDMPEDPGRELELALEVVLAADLQLVDATTGAGVS
ncbi:MAG: FAD-dependent monooxygenase, partial [Actinomycetaceae bacterium]